VNATQLLVLVDMPDDTDIHYVGTLASQTFQAASFYSVLHGFMQGKFANGGSILGSSQFLQLAQRPFKTMHAIKAVKINLKIIISLP
jgi:hypothetical protein